MNIITRVLLYYRFVCRGHVDDDRSSIGQVFRSIESLNSNDTLIFLFLSISEKVKLSRKKKNLVKVLRFLEK